MVKKYALLIGINYIGTSSQLSGCINDVNNVKNVLIDKFGYSSEDITLMTDYSDTSLRPTKSNILNHLSKIVNLSFTRRTQEPVDEIWIHYSGHGSYMRDTSGDEKDGCDETICPLDYSTNGFISDDELNRILQKLNQKVRLICLFDSCHSGTIIDLKYKYNLISKRCDEDNKSNKINCAAICISGCMDNQTSADAYGLENNASFSGAMTSSFLHALKMTHYKGSISQIVLEMRNYLKKNGFSQIPQLTCSFLLDYTTPLQGFSLPTATITTTTNNVVNSTSSVNPSLTSTNIPSILIDVPVHFQHLISQSGIPANNFNYVGNPGCLIM